MIIECKTCSKKFVVSDNAIPSSGRMVQCSNCNQKWFQKPQSDTKITKKTSKKLASSENIKASDGKFYKFLGQQWGQVLPSGKTGVLASKKISEELHQLTNKTFMKDADKVTVINPSKSLAQKNKKQIKSDKENYKSLGFFGYIFLIFLISISLIGIVETFKEEIIKILPETESQLNFVYETFENILIIVKDFFKQY